MAKKKSYEFRFAHIEIRDLGTAVILGETNAKNKHGRRAVKPPRPTRSQARRCNVDAQSNPVASERKRSHGWAECGRREEACGANVGADVSALFGDWVPSAARGL